MIPSPTTNKTVQAGAIAKASFQISATNGAHIMGILREGLYSDKPLAVLREYAANAWDAHRAAGKPELPIEINLPSSDSPMLKIRDHGPGLSRTEMFELYTQYGDSTKRTGNDQVGMMGIGSKSAFCYTTSFTIVSWHGGTRSVYVADLGEDDVGGISLVHESPCEENETGMEVQVATRPEDRYEFHATARKLFQHFEPRPIVTVDGEVFMLPAPPDEQTILTSGVIYPESGDWIAVMGCVPYRIDMDKMDAREVNPALAHMSGRLKFDIGEVQVSASREDLKYTAQTKSALVARANALVDEFVLHALKQLEDGNITGWQARLQVRVLQQLELPLPEEWRPLAEVYAKVTYDPAVLTIVHNRAGCTRVVVEEGTRLLLDDSGGKDIAGYDLDSDDYVVRAVDPITTTDELRTALDGVLATAGLTGVKVELLSSLYWRVPAADKLKRANGWKNPKHRAKMFQLLLDGKHLPKRKAPKSDNWEAVTRPPAHEDVFVIIKSFEATTGGCDDKQFWTDINHDRDLCAALGVDFPPIYGYKSTEKRPVSESACVGIAYRAWRRDYFQGLMTDERRVTLDQCWQADPTVHEPSEVELEWLREHLGPTHLIVTLFEDVKAADGALTEAGVNRTAIVNLGDRCGIKRSACWFDQHTEAVLAPYKILKRSGFRDLWRKGWSSDEATNNEERLEWVEYVKMVDARLAPAPQNVVALRSVP